MIQEQLDYNKEYKKLKTTNLILQKENEFLKKNLLELKYFNIFSETILYKIFKGVFKFFYHIIWFGYRVIRKIKNIIIGLFKGGKKNAK